MKHAELIPLLWAKSDPFHPLTCHLLDVAAVVQALLRDSSLETSAQTLQKSLGYDDCDAFACWVAFVCSLHDIGKCDPRFQAKAPELVEVIRQAGGRELFPSSIETVVHGFRHEVRSADWAIDWLLDSLDWDRRVANLAARVLEGHHGSFLRHGSSAPFLDKIGWGDLRSEIASILRETITPPENTKAIVTNFSGAGVLLSGIMVLSDWIASNRELYNPPAAGMSYRDYYECCNQAAKSSLCRLGFDRPVRIPKAHFTSIFPDIQKPRPLQEEVMKLVLEHSSPSLTIIEAPMGEGKTEAALYLATQGGESRPDQGLYVALPTSATSNQMYKRVRKFLGKHDTTAAAGTRLVHGMAWLIDDTTPESNQESDDQGSQDSSLAKQWFRPSKRALLAPAAVGTIDQALMSILHVRFGFLRLLGLSSKTVIIDEAHAYDAFMMEELILLLRWLSVLDVSIIVLSATLPEAKCTELCKAYMNPEQADQPTDARQADKVPQQALKVASEKQYPLITRATRGNWPPAEFPVEGCAKTQRIHLEKHIGLLGDCDKIVSLLLDLASEGGCVAYIANTVTAAQAVFHSLSDRKSEKDITLFHARFTADRRASIEQDVTDRFGPDSLYPRSDSHYKPRPDRAIVVATQVIEQSLDLDFDIMVSEIAPIDLLIQRAGRLYRHDRTWRPTGEDAKLHILLPVHDELVFGSTEKVYERFLVLKTLAALQRTEYFDLPAKMRPLIEAVYDENPENSCIGNADLRTETRRAYETFVCRREKEREEARKYLWPTPASRSFEVSRIPSKPFSDEDPDPEAGSFLAAKTRLERYPSVRTVLLEGNAFHSVLQSDRSPSRQVLRDLLLRSVSLPLWWIDGAQEESGFHPIEEAPRWLHGYRVIRMQNCVWRGCVNNESIEILDDPLLGIVRKDTRD
jgi:CRISPR-associated endonuclease/helicase Cas3